MSFPLPWIERLRKTRMIAVFNPESHEQAEESALSLYAAGFKGLELTLRTAASLESIRKIKLACPDMIVGVGTVLNEHQVAAVQGAGADFATAPGFNPTVVKAAQKAGLPFAPGVCTPTEIENAFALGCRLLNFFPSAQDGGPAHLGAISEPYLSLGLHFVPHGKITSSLVLEFLQMPQVTALCVSPAEGSLWEDLAPLAGHGPPN